MGLLDFIFGNKKKKEQERLEKERQAELQRKENERIAKEREARLAENQRKEKERKASLEKKKEQEQTKSNDTPTTFNNKKEDEGSISKPNTKIMQEDTEVSEYLQYLAAQSNFSFRMGNKNDAVNLMTQLFKTCHGRNGHKLLQISSNNTQSIGLAFTSIALHLNFNDSDLNSVAAENAIYCLGRSIIEKDNTFCAPSIFTILLKHPSLLKDKLISTHISVSEKRVGMPIGMMLGGNPFIAPHLSDFREQATEEKRIAIMAYMLSLFYDTKLNEYKVPTDVVWNLPSMNDISNFSTLVKNNIKYDYLALENEGKDYFYELFNMCQETLRKMI